MPWKFLSLVVTGRRGRQCVALTLRVTKWAEPQGNGSLKSAVQRQSAVLGGSEVPVPGGVQGEGGDVVAAGILRKISKLQFWVGEKSRMVSGAPSSAGSQGVNGEQGRDGLVSRDRQRGKGTLVCARVCSWGLRRWGVGKAIGRGWWGEESRTIQLPCLFWGNHDAGAREGREQLCPTEALETIQFLFRTSRMRCVAVGDSSGPPRCLVPQLEKARTPPAGPFLAPASAATLGPSRSRDQAISRTGDGKEVPRSQGCCDPMSLGPWALGDHSPGFAFASLLPKSSLAWQQVPRL